jgi:hypothetical protein
MTEKQYQYARNRRGKSTMIQLLQKEHPEILKQLNIKVINVKDVMKKKVEGNSCEFIWIDELASKTK